MTDLFTIDGQEIPVPDAPVAVKLTDIEGECARDRSGMLHRTVLRRVKSWEFSYQRLGEGDRAYLEALLIPGVFQFAHPEGESLCCCKGIQGDYFDGVNGLWNNVRFRVEEV